MWLICFLFEIMFYYILPLILVVQFIRFCLADADLTVLYKEKFGRPISSLNGKVVWITGASSGIGEYAAYNLAQNCKDIRLILSARREDELKRVKQACIGYGLKESAVKIVILDLADIQKHNDVVAEAVQCFGVVSIPIAHLLRSNVITDEVSNVDILINNAGRSQRSLAMQADISVDQYLCQLNVIGTISLTKSILHNHMYARGKGLLVVISSLAGKFGVPGSSGYSASKFALHGFFEALNSELFATNPGIKTSIICPGAVVSNVGKNALSDNADKQVGESGMDNSKKMPTDRFAHLMSVAIANEIDEVWISNHLPLLMTYLMQYTPSVGKWLMNLTTGPRLKAMASGKLDYGNFFSMLWAGLFDRFRNKTTKK
ncbi:Dehydrogenase/reductase SDR family member 7 [Trichoplax sp. H2]|nr:Dehydrogenase/reductase SDR family member 7 [Trichoplax sp. H2]|eukprot:RDD40065.1 Dehydrogenase/reductase SDR family member 7 [Trichoplax sp. H2]